MHGKENAPDLLDISCAYTKKSRVYTGDLLCMHNSLVRTHKRILLCIHKRSLVYTKEISCAKDPKRALAHIDLSGKMSEIVSK